MPTISFSWNGTGSGDWLPYVLAAYVLVWFFVLVLALTRRDIDPVTRLTWIIVIVFVPVGGLLLYGLFAPPRWSPSAGAKSDVRGTPWEKSPGHTPGDF